MDSFSSRRFVAQARAGGFHSCYASAGTSRSAGVALLGPPELREDPWVWGPEHQGRVVSGILSVRGHADVLIVVVYGDVDSQDNRARLYDDVAARAAQAGLPTIVVGDFNCEPYDPELYAFRGTNYCHELLDMQDITTYGERLLDFACSQQLEARTFATDTAISDRDAIVFELQREFRTEVQTAVKFDELDPPLETEDWDEIPHQAMDRRLNEWDDAAPRQDTEATWALRSDMLEESAGVPSDRHQRKHETLKRWERVCKGPDGGRRRSRCASAGCSGASTTPSKGRGPAPTASPSWQCPQRGSEPRRRRRPGRGHRGRRRESGSALRDYPREAPGAR